MNELTKMMDIILLLHRRRYQEVTLPTEECRNCSIQLVRQAGEWSAGSCGQYLFWSCADVNIASGKDIVLTNLSWESRKSTYPKQ